MALNYKDLNVFKEAHQLVLNIYKIIDSFPKRENYRINDQIIRAAYSVPSNIAEGNSRNTTKDYLSFLYISRGSLNELQYFMLLSKDLGYINDKIYQEVNSSITNIAIKLNALIKSLKRKLK
ncbi:MAG: four helix bundle protein [Candidatus Omnitrophica bacterium]|nr:four helix bundle protein [Candidatus Omnitrophota bacterium]